MNYTTKDFNEKVSELLQCPITNLEQIKALRWKIHEIAEVILEKYTQKAKYRNEPHVEEWASEAIEYFMENYIPGENGETPKLKIDKSPSGALIKKFEGKRLDFYKHIDVVKKYKGQKKVEDTERNDRNLVKEDNNRLFNEAALTKTGPIVRGRLEFFSSEIKRKAFMSYLYVKEINEITEEDWCAGYLPLFRSNEVNGKTVQMDYDDFKQYYRTKLPKFRDKLRAICIKKGYDIFGHADKTDTMKIGRHHFGEIISDNSYDAHEFLHWINAGRVNEMNSKAKRCYSHLLVCKQCREYFVKQILSQTDEELYARNVAYIYELFSNETFDFDDEDDII